LPIKIHKRFCCRLALARFLLAASLSALVAQTIPAGLDQEPQKAGAVQDESGYTLHLTTREVLVEVVARDRQNHPVNDLTQSDFNVFEGKHQSAEGQKAISGFRIIDPVLTRCERALCCLSVEGAKFAPMCTTKSPSILGIGPVATIQSY